jgi:isoleucyl-tRNA synthetase
VDEGLAREIISKIQQMRKQLQLEMMDNITIALSADEEVQKAVDKHADYIKSETLATVIAPAEELKTVNINGHKTGLEIKKA